MTQKTVFFITDAKNEKAVFDVDWVGLRLEEYNIEDDVISNLPTCGFHFQKGASNYDRSIQFYMTKEDALSVVNQLHTRDQVRVVEDLKIVEFNFQYSMKSETIESDKKLAVLFKFEDDSQSNLSEFRNESNNGYTDPEIEKRFQGWLAFNQIKIS